MVNKKTRFILTLLLVCLIFNIYSVESQAKFQIPRVAWRDDNGNILFYTKDTKRVNSSMGYRTVGLTVSRTVMGTKTYSPNHEYITFPFTSNKVQADIIEANDGTVETYFTVREEELLAKIATYYPDWLAELQSGDTCYVAINCVMVCCTTVNGVRIDYGQLIDDNSRTSLIFGNTYWHTIDSKCQNCGGVVPPLMDGFYKDMGDMTQICYGHPNIIHDGYK